MPSTSAEEGSWSGSAITSKTRFEDWSLDQLGNWDLFRRDLNGDGDYIDADELNDDRTHTVVNELTARDTDNNGTNDYTLTYDTNGNLTDDGKDYKYEYDAFGRLRTIKKTSDSTLVAEFTYNGLGYRIGSHEDTDADGDVDVSDTWLRFVYDERWRIVGVYHDSDTAPTEQFVYHNAGMDGTGGSSYIDSVVFRDRDTTANGTLDERVYYCQNWRADVVALVSDAGGMLEWVRYSPYGVPFGSRSVRQVAHIRPGGLPGEGGGC